MSETKRQEIEIQLEEQVGQGHYCNLAIITHSTSEFILDFATMLPGLPKARVRSRIILTPEHAKRLLLSLQENITRYESSLGPINIRAKQPILDPFGGKGNAEQVIYSRISNRKEQKYSLCGLFFITLESLALIRQHKESVKIYTKCLFFLIKLLHLCYELPRIGCNSTIRGQFYYTTR